MDNNSWSDIAHWWNPNTISSFEYEREWLFYASLAAPIIVFSIIAIQAITIFFGKYDHKTASDPKYRVSISSFLKLIPFTLISGTVFFLGLALSGPFKSEDHSETWTEGIDILLVLDVSGSMDLKDFKPNRLEKVKEVALDFIEGRDSDKIGLIEFAGEAFSRAPLTTDYDNLKKHIADVSLEDLADAQGTAIGNALGLGTYRMENSESASKVIILISDGDNTAGNIQPEYAAEEAKKAGIKVYTIGVGKNGKVLAGNSNLGPFSTPYYVNNSLDEGTLKMIANTTNGKYFRATNSAGLNKIFKTINELETREIKESHYRTTKNYYFIYLTWGILALLGWLLTKATFITNGTLD